MVKKNIVLFCLSFFCICNAIEINESALKKYPKSIKFIDFKDGDYAWEPKQYRPMATVDDRIVIFFPRLCFYEKKYTILIYFFNTFSNLDSFSLKMNSGKLVNLKFKKGEMEKFNGIEYYKSTIPMSIAEFFNLFIKEFPEAVIVKTNHENLSLPLNPWFNDFNQMKIFFKANQR